MLKTDAQLLIFQTLKNFNLFSLQGVTNSFWLSHIQTIEQ